MSYSETYFTARESWRDWRIEARHLIDLARVVPGARVLEIGCGGGGLLRLLGERGADVVGVDTLDTALDLARKRLNTDEHRPAQKDLVRVGDDAALPFHDSAFDAVIGQHVIEHLPDVDAALREYKRVLKTSGHIALATPNARHPDPAHFSDADHTRIFAPRELQQAAERAGFVIDTCYTIFPFLSHVRALRGFGIIAHRVFQHAPYFSIRGRTILLAARKQ